MHYQLFTECLFSAVTAKFAVQAIALCCRKLPYIFSSYFNSVKSGVRINQT
jgi:hypothetical protein